MFAAAVAVILESKTSVLLHEDNGRPKLQSWGICPRKGTSVHTPAPSLRSVTIPLHSSLSHYIYIIFKINRLKKSLPETLINSSLPCYTSSFPSVYKLPKAFSSQNPLIV